jgi:O-antigen/teichoic acid export membrane protein
MSDYIKRTLGVFSTQVFILPLSIITGILIARYLGATGKGVLAIMLLVSTIIKLLGGFGMEFSNVYFTSKEPTRFHEIFSNNLLIWVTSSAFFILLALLLRDYVLKQFLPGFNSTIYNLALLIFPFLLWSGYALTLCQGLEHFFKFNLLRIVEPATRLIGLILLVVLFRKGILGGAYAILLSYLVPTLLSFLILMKNIKSKLSINRNLLHKSIKYGMKGQVGIFFQFFNYRLDMFLVNYFLGINAVGFYTVSVTIAELLWHIPNSISLTLFPRVSRKERTHANDFTSKVSRNSIPLMLFSALAIGLLSSFLIPILYGNEFAQSILPLQILLPGIIAFGLAKILTNHLHGMGKPHYGSIVTMCSLILTILFDMLLIPKIGIIGAAAATTIAYTISLLLTIVFFVTESHLPLKKFMLPSFEFFYIFIRLLKRS